MFAEADKARGVGKIGVKGAAVPKGFSSIDYFVRFGADAREGIVKAGYGNVEPILQGQRGNGTGLQNWTGV